MIDFLISDKGTTRENNQDTIDYQINQNGDRIYILCDGMGGYKGGEVASFECCKLVKDRFKKSKFDDVENAKSWLYKAIMDANKKIQTLAKKDEKLAKMGTTIVCFIVSERFKVYASVGDSRIYSYSHKELNQLSEDQTFAQALLKAGYINEKEAEIHPKKNLLLSAIGSNEDDIDIQINEINGKCNYLLCSDGLYNMVEGKEILKVLNSNASIEVRANTLINLANENGGKDNVSVILVEDCL